jgi:hypothetical protein
MNRVLIFLIILIVSGCGQSSDYNYYNYNDIYYDVDHDSLLERANIVLTDTIDIDSIRVMTKEKLEIIDNNSVELERRARVIEQQKREIEQIKLQYKQLEYESNVEIQVDTIK